MNRYFIPVIAVLFAALTNCQKVIDVDLNSDDPKVVIEGFVIEGEDTHTVTITRTLNFDEDAEFPTVNNAIVILSDDLGNTQTLLSAGNGRYQTTGFPAVSGRTYTLSVTVDGNTYNASGTIPAFVPLDSVIVQTYNFGSETIQTLVPSFLDPAGSGNYYQYRITRNDTLINGILLQDDQYIDGNVNEQPIFDGSFTSGDSIDFELFCIDKPVYKYFLGLSQNSSATPANPVSNFSGGCLGYFSARTRSQKSIVIP